MSLSVKQEIMALQPRSYVNVNNILIDRTGGRLREQTSARCLSLAFCLDFVITVGAFSTVIVGAKCAAQVVLITGATILPIGIIGLPILFYLHRRVENFEVPQKEIDTYLTNYEKDLQFQTKWNARKIAKLQQANRKMAQEQADLRKTGIN